MKNKNKNIISAALGITALASATTIGAVAQMCSTGTTRTDNIEEIVNDLNDFDSGIFNIENPQTQIQRDFARGTRVLIYNNMMGGTPTANPTDDNLEPITLDNIYVGALDNSSVSFDEDSNMFTITITELLVTASLSSGNVTNRGIWGGAANNTPDFAIVITASLNSNQRPQINADSFGVQANATNFVEIFPNPPSL